MKLDDRYKVKTTNRVITERRKKGGDPVVGQILVNNIKREHREIRGN